MDKLKITNPNGNVHYVPAFKRNIENHTKRNNLLPEDRRDKLEIVKDVVKDGDTITHGEVAETLHEGSINAAAAKSTIAKASADIAAKDKEIEDLKAQLAAKEAPAAPAPNAAAPKAPAPNAVKK